MTMKKVSSSHPPVTHGLYLIAARLPVGYALLWTVIYVRKVGQKGNLAANAVVGRFDREPLTDTALWPQQFRYRDTKKNGPWTLWKPHETLS